MNLEEIKENFNLTGDYHTHTVYSRVGPYRHGKGRIADNVRAAAGKGLREIAVTDHGPFDLYGIKIGLIPRMREEIAEAAKEFPGVKIYLGVEADIVDTANGLDVAPEDFEKFDFINAGYHYVSRANLVKNLLAFNLPWPVAGKERLRRENTDRIVKALKSNNVYVLTHPGDKAYIDTEAVAKACEETDTLVEINARHKHPNADELKIFAAHDVKFIIGSDAHRPDNVGRYAESLALAFEAGIDAERIVNIERREK